MFNWEWLKVFKLDPEEKQEVRPDPPELVFLKSLNWVEDQTTPAGYPRYKRFKTTVKGECLVFSYYLWAAQRSTNLYLETDSKEIRYIDSVLGGLATHLERLDLERRNKEKERIEKKYEERVEAFNKRMGIGDD